MLSSHCSPSSPELPSPLHTSDLSSICSCMDPQREKHRPPHEGLQRAYVLGRAQAQREHGTHRGQGPPWHPAPLFTLAGSQEARHSQSPHSTDEATKTQRTEAICPSEVPQRRVNPELPARLWDSPSFPQTALAPSRHSRCSDLCDGLCVVCAFLCVCSCTSVLVCVCV